MYYYLLCINLLFISLLRYLFIYLLLIIYYDKGRLSRPLSSTGTLWRGASSWIIMTTV